MELIQRNQTHSFSSPPPSKKNEARRHVDSIGITWLCYKKKEEKMWGGNNRRKFDHGGVLRIRGDVRSPFIIISFFFLTFMDIVLSFFVESMKKKIQFDDEGFSIFFSSHCDIYKKKGRRERIRSFTTTVRA